MKSRDPVSEAHEGRTIRIPRAPDANIWMAPMLVVPQLLREFGIDPEAVVKRSGLDLSLFVDPEARVPFEAAGRFGVECADATGCPHFGLLIGHRAGASAVGIFGALARHSVTVGAGLRVLITHLYLHDRGAALTLHPWSASEVELAYVIHRADTPGTVHITDASLAILFQIMRSLCGPQWTPTLVTFSHGQRISSSVYRSFFQAPVRFNQPRSALVFPSALLGQAIIGAEVGERTRLSRTIAALEQVEPASVTERALRAVCHVLVAASPSEDCVARVMGMSSRSLRRRLAAEGTSLKALVEEVRYAFGRQLLEDTVMPISEIAATLHYGQPSAFSRAFKTWTGTTPHACRDNAQRQRRTGKPR